MPTSSDAGKDFFKKHFDRLISDRAVVIDVGAGEGTYPKRFKKKNQTWIGLEAFDPYIERYRLKDHYNFIFPEDARYYDWSMAHPDTELVIFGDVLEHMTHEESHKLIHTALDVAKYVYISAPIGRCPQGPSNGNELERHVQDWNHDEFIEYWERNLIAYSTQRDYNFVSKPTIGSYWLSKRMKG